MALQCTALYRLSAEQSLAVCVQFRTCFILTFVKSILAVERYTTHKVFVCAKCVAILAITLKFVAVVIVSGLFKVGTVFDGASAADGLLQHCWHSLV